ncbi:uncharacterized protein EDB91DRAFT_1238559 [Suillus paluster]|uniref:uncharacterized protein n=1 Tax=Suillus paluster TaxID=48578 RepID=UPI001B881CEB|nr:uncharacterized protein EDB91DRAFT_1238559 [Suillus paluster]KAG1733631.1 hypothetical protein EDB91DRAFT_1238559 [Suillus paluster]
MYRDVEPLTKPIIPAFPLDDSLYCLEPEEIAFFKRQTNIQDEVALKTHIIGVQKEAYKVAPYPCIRGFHFLHPNISKLPNYDHILKRGSEGAILLDIGSCLGIDVRKAAEDGFPAHNIIASDIKEAFSELGCKLFKSSSEPSYFIPGDVFDPAFLSITQPASSVPEDAMPDIQTLRSLNDLRGRVGVIHASKLFQLFEEKKQLELARALGGLLSCEPGSIICGSVTIASEKGIFRQTVLGVDITYFCHSPETWTALWDGVVFAKGQVKVETSTLSLDCGRHCFLYFILEPSDHLWPPSPAPSVMIQH